MIAALLGVLLAARPPIDAAAADDCVPDADSLVAEAHAAVSTPVATPEGLARARALLRAARRLDPTPALALEGADLAFASGDAEEGDDLLASVAETEVSLLSRPELLRLALRAETRRRWKEAADRYRDLGRALDRAGETAGWIAPRLRELELEADADRIAAPSSGPPIEARLALADARSALAAGRLRDARASVRAALRISPAYVEALLTLAAIETRAKRPDAAVRACREALVAEPDRVEALTLLSNLLWEEPDRSAKEESLTLLERAVSLRPDSRPLLRLSAVRWAEYGDAARARQRLDAFLSHATGREREELAPLRESLSARPAALAPTPAAAPTPEEPASAAVDRWRKAQVYAARGDDASLTAALSLLAEAEALDPGLARVPELSAALHEKRGEWKAAEDDLRRAIRADPSRATTYESLARLLEREPARAGETEKTWRLAGEAGSTEAWFRLAQSAERAGRASEARVLYARYRDEAPAGLHAGEAAAASERLESRRRLWIAGGAVALMLLAAIAGVAVHRRRTARTLEEWLSLHPENAAEARRIVARLRHEALKHGGMLLSDSADRLERGDPAARRDAASLLASRLFGDGPSRGLVEEVGRAASALGELARGGGVRLDIAGRDPVLAHLLAGERALRGTRRPLERLAKDGTASERSLGATVRRLRRAAREWRLASGAELERAIDRAAALPVRLDALEALLAMVAAEGDRAAPPLEILHPADANGLPPVRVSAADWETLWRNLFRNALASARLAVSAAERRDPSTGESRLRFVLFDELPDAVSADAIRERPADRGLGVVSEILTRNDGSFHVVPAEAPGFTKGLGFELPAVETPA